MSDIWKFHNDNWKFKSSFLFRRNIFSTQVQSNRLIDQLYDSLMEPDKEYLEFQNLFTKYLKITKNIQISRKKLQKNVKLGKIRKVHLRKYENLRK